MLIIHKYGVAPFIKDCQPRLWRPLFLLLSLAIQPTLSAVYAKLNFTIFISARPRSLTLNPWTMKFHSCQSPGTPDWEPVNHHTNQSVKLKFTKNFFCSIFAFPAFPFPQWKNKKEKRGERSENTKRSCDTTQRSGPFPFACPVIIHVPLCRCHF